LSPQAVSQQPVHQQRFDDAVRQHVDRREELGVITMELVFQPS
jgi:hypothetical protein